MYALHLQLVTVRALYQHNTGFRGRPGNYNNHTLDSRDSYPEFGPIPAHNKPSRKSVWESGPKRRGRKRTLSERDAEDSADEEESDAEEVTGESTIQESSDEEEISPYGDED